MDMEKKTYIREKYERNTTESGLATRNSKVVHKRKSRAPLREWQTTEDQSNNKVLFNIGIEEYKRNNLPEYCSKIFIVVPTGEDECVTQDTFAKFESEKVLVNKSEYDFAKPGSTIFNKDSIGQFLYDVQSKTSLGEKDIKSTRTMETRKNGRTLGSLQKRHVFKQTYREPSVPAVKNLEPDTILPRQESFVLQSLVNKPRPKPRSGGKHGHRQQNCHMNNNDRSAIECSRTSFDEQVTCSSHVYTFNRGLVPSRDAHSLELFHPQHFLPPVVANRIGNISEQKHYRLPREKDEKSSNNARYFLNALYSKDPSLEQKTESKSIVYKEFPAETVIPAAYGRRRYFDFQGYIEFLCKERNLRKTSALNARQLDDWEKLGSSSWLNNLSDALAKDVFDYSGVLDIKGSRMKLDENRVQMRYPTKPLSELHRNCFLANSNKIYFKPQKTLKGTSLRSRKSKEKTVLIERLPSKFQFTLPGRPPSSDDSGFAE